MTRFLSPLRGNEFYSPSDEAISARVSADSYPRIRIDAGGRITWSSGSVSGDTNLYRSNENVLTTDDIFKATAGLVTVTASGAPSYSMPDGGIAIDTTNDVFYFRSNGTWNQVSGGGATLTVSDSIPTEDLVEGDLWFESDTGKTFVYYDSFWVEVGSPGYGNGSASVNFLAFPSDIIPQTNNIYSLGSPTHRWQEVYVGPGSLYIQDADTGGNVEFTVNNGYLQLNGQPISASVGANSVALGTHTTGSYVQSLVAGTGVTLTNNSGESATPTIAIGQAVSTTSNVTFNDLVVSGNLTVSGTTTTINTATLSIADNIITLNSDFTSGAPTENSGVEVLRGSASTVSIRWNETSDVWQFTNNGSAFVDIVGTTTEQTLTNKTLTSPTITGVSPILTLNGDLSGSVQFTNLGNATLTATVAANSVQLGADTTGNYMANVSASTGIHVSHTQSEGSTATISLDAHLDNLTDVTITGTPVDKQLIIYDAATSQWKNADPIVSTGIAYKSGVPASKTSTGTLGQLAIDGANGVLYICTSTNNWQKVSLNAANFTNAGGFA